MQRLALAIILALAVLALAGAVLAGLRRLSAPPAHGLPARTGDGPGRKIAFAFLALLVLYVAFAGPS